MSQKQSATSKNKQVAIVIGATSKWQADRRTLLVYGKALENRELPVGARWGVGGAIGQKRPEIVMDPVKIAEAFYYLHTQDRSCWTHELPLIPFPTKPSFQGASFPKSSEVQGKKQDRRARIPMIVLPFEPRVSIYY